MISAQVLHIPFYLNQTFFFKKIGHSSLFVETSLIRSVAINAKRGSHLIKVSLLVNRQEEERRRREEEMLRKREMEEQMRRQREENYRMGNFMDVS